MLWSCLPSRSKTSTVLWSSAVRNRRWPLRSSAKWSKSPEKPGKAVVATNFSGCFSCALTRGVNIKMSDRHIPSILFILVPLRSCPQTAHLWNSVPTDGGRDGVESCCEPRLKDDLYGELNLSLWNGCPDQLTRQPARACV